jgi:hypothetical protein
VRAVGAHDSTAQTSGSRAARAARPAGYARPMTATPQDDPQTDDTEPKPGVNDAQPGENDTDEPLTSM